ncbi:Sec34-like family-domain-containing protein [Protomyces lactucae-debilis]|uniref:Conserved oligomeric Golgi complex subunit 3 n=1 Tax=Protomyces lactucae-debilis TaxID=2754530 RepID=A0A1Y2FNW4_PROLT|nr:Sec34-like family-domain-containing protein [Protomyces lactucae-debilis]ORY84405.1 Sec34-like family-domain-containing protein [Protomyces lactucae-debilis]
MDDYLYAYSDLRPPSPIKARSPSPPLAPCIPKVAKSPPRADVRRRPRSLQGIELPRPILPRDATHWDVKEIEEAHLDDEQIFEDLQDLQLKQIKETSLLRLVSCRAVLDQADRVLSVLAGIKDGFDAVAEQTHTLQTRCNELQAEEARMTSLADDIKETLQPFSYLPTAVRLLNVPGSDLVLQPSYRELLNRVETSLEFLEQHPDYKDADVFTRSYRQCMTKALTLIRVHFNTALRQVTADVTSKMSNGLNKNTQAALLYTKFRSLSPSMAPLLMRLSQASKHHTEYESLLNDCLSAYFATRKALLASTLATTFKDFALIKELDSFATSSVSFMRSLVADEQELFRAFFPEVDGAAFANFQATLGPSFTDAMGPRITAETSLTRLCEVCASLQAQCVQEDNTHGLDLSPLFTTTLQQLEARVATLARAAIASNITGYAPTEQDLDYHGKLVRRQRTRPALSRTGSVGHSLAPSSSSVFDDSETVQSGLQGSSADWYITLRTSIALLSKIYRLVQSSLFDALAHEVVRGCLSSLLSAASSIRRKNLVNGQLFLIKHLLLLREQMAGFELEHLPEASGLEQGQGITATLWDAAAKGDLFSPSALYSLASSGFSRLAAGALSRPVENMQDARLELEDQLQLAVNQLVASCADGITQPLRSCMGNKQTKPEALVEANRKFRAGLPDAFALFREALQLYLDDEQEPVAGVLLEMAQDKTLETYERFDSYLRMGKLHETLPVDQQVASVLDTAAWVREISGWEKPTY